MDKDYLILKRASALVAKTGRPLKNKSHSLTNATTATSKKSPVQAQMVSDDRPTNMESHLSSPTNATAATSKKSPVQAQLVSDEAPLCPQGLVFPLLRQNFEDIGLLGCPEDVDKATGASISYTDDYVAQNRSWAVNGTAAVVYASVNDKANRSTSVAAYVTVDRSQNSNKNLTSKNVDVIAGGGALELGSLNILGGQQYFRLRVGAITDNIQNTTAVSAVAEWIPVYFAYNIHFPFALIGPSGAQFNPEIVAQFDRSTDRHELAFSDHHDAFRIGPQIRLLLFPMVRDGSILSRLSANWSAPRGVDRGEDLRIG